MRVAIGDEILDSTDFEAVLTGEDNQFGQPHHLAIIVHDLADHPRRVEPGEPRDIDRGFGMAGANEHAAIARHQRKDMARRDDFARPLAAIDGDGDRPRPVTRRNAGGDAFARFDRDSESGAVTGAIMLRHERQAKVADAFGGQGEADQAATVAGHEIDRIGGRHLRRNDKIALVFAVFIIDKDEHAAVAGFVDDFLHAGERRALRAVTQPVIQLAQGFGGGIPIGIIKVAQRIGVKPGGAGDAGFGLGAISDKGTQAFGRAHAGISHCNVMDIRRVTLQCQ